MIPDIYGSLIKRGDYVLARRIGNTEYWKFIEPNLDNWYSDLLIIGLYPAIHKWEMKYRENKKWSEISKYMGGITMEEAGKRLVVFSQTMNRALCLT